MVMIDQSPEKVHRKFDTEHGAVLGIDVGWSTKKPTTGLCLIEWANWEISLRCCKARADEDDCHTKLNQLVQGRRLLAVGIDGPLIPKLESVNEYRPVEALLSRSKFQRRGKPGPTNGGNGQELHKQATQLAKLVVNTQNVDPATYHYKIHKKAVVEAFPNAFLAVLHPDKGFPSKPKTSRNWTDILFPLVKQELWQLLKVLLPQNKPNFSLGDIQGHEEIAAFLCALTALCAATAQGVAVGDQRLGYITLPPLELWGESVGGDDKWASEALRNNLASVRHQFNYVVLYKDNELWTP